MITERRPTGLLLERSTVKARMMTLISTQDLSRLPSVARLWRILQSMAMLDAILCPEWEYRYYSFNSLWSPDESMGSMRNGQGNDFFALFNSHGCFLKGFAHESLIAAASITPAEHYRGLAAEFAACATEPAFKAYDVTFCIWRTFTATQWSRSPVPLPVGDDPDGSIHLLSPLGGNPETYWRWAESYYERDVSLLGVKTLYEQQRLTEDLIVTLNPELRLKDIEDDIREINYPNL